MIWVLTSKIKNIISETNQTKYKNITRDTNQTKYKNITRETNQTKHSTNKTEDVQIIKTVFINNKEHTIINFMK